MKKALESVYVFSLLASRSVEAFDKSSFQGPAITGTELQIVQEVARGEDKASLGKTRLWFSFWREIKSLDVLYAVEMAVCCDH